MRLRLYFFLPLVFLTLGLPQESLSREKITVAVFDFEAKNINQETADAATDLLRTELFNTGRFQVAERDQIRKVLDEQNFQMSGLTDVEDAVEIGRLLNVRAIMVGSVNRLGSTYFINMRLISVRTGMVGLAESIKCTGGEEKLPDAISDLARKIAQKVGLEGSIVQFEEKHVFIDLGTDDGLKTGDVLSVIRLGDVIKDLEERVIGTQDAVIGSIEITQVQERFSEATIKEQSDTLKIGDRVKPFDEAKNLRVTDKEKEKSPDVPIIF
jgi:TolB-like protein